MVMIPPPIKPSRIDDDEGLVEGLLTGLKAIPHLPNAIARGIDEPGISEDEKELRRRALSEAAQWVLPVFVSGGASLALKALGKPLISAILSDAAGLAIGSGAAAAVNEENVPLAAGQGALFGGLFGAGRGYFAQGAKQAAARAASTAAAGAATRVTQVANKRLGPLFEAGLGGKAAVRGGQLELNPLAPLRSAYDARAGQQLDLFDLGLPPNTARMANVEATEQLPQLSLFGEAPTVMGASSSLALRQARAAGVPATAMAQQELWHMARESQRPVLGQEGFILVHAPALPPAQLELPLDVTVGKRVLEAKPFGSTGQLELFGGGPGRPPSDFDGSLAKVSPDSPVPPPVGSTTVAGGLNQFQTDTERSVATALNLRGITPSKTVVDVAGLLEKPKPTAGAVTEAFAPEQVLQAADEAAKKSLTGPMLSVPGLRQVMKNITDAPVVEQAMLMVHRALAPARTTLVRMGPAGTALAHTLDEIFTSWRLKSGTDVAAIRQVFKGFGLKDRTHIGEIMEGIAAPKSEQHLLAAEAAEEIYARHGREAGELDIRELLPSGGVKEFEMRRNYLTHYYDDKLIKKTLTPGTPEFKRAMAIIEGRGEALAQKEALSALKSWLSAPPEFRTGPINFPRNDILGLPYEKDPLKVMSRYVYSVRKRLEVARKYGGDYRGVEDVYRQIATEGGNPKVAKNIFDAFNDRLPRDYADLVRAASTYNVLTMLSMTAGFVQPSQLINTAAIAGYGNLIRALGAIQSKTEREWVISTGAHINEVIQDMLGVTGSDLSNWWVKYGTLLEPLDKANRMVAAVAGRMHAEQTAEKFAKKQTPRLAEQLTRLMLDPAEVLAQGGKLTEEQLKKAGLRVSLDTQFATSVLDLPELRNSSVGRVVYQFKTFALQQTNFVMKDIIAPMKAGNFGPVTRYAAGMGPISYPMATLIRGVKGRPAPNDPALKKIEDLAMVGSFGGYYDTWMALAAGPDRFLSLLIGPTATEATRFLASDIPNVVRGNPRTLAKHILSRIPNIGQPLINYWLFPPGTK